MSRQNLPIELKDRQILPGRVLSEIIDWRKFELPYVGPNIAR
tara:strand:- start:284 stop:409 length:126 start_codon:yes stop_codon:yes gene_type:complete